MSTLLNAPLLYFITFILCVPQLLAQPAPYAGTKLYCEWNQVSLRSGPGKEAPYIKSIFFGEELEPTGRESYAREEQRTYIEVRTSEGSVGWVHEFLLVEGIGMGVVIESGRIYKRPRTVSTLTDQSFLPGEIVVIVAENNGWIQLIGREKTKLGWMEGAQKVTSSSQELELASLLHEAELKKLPAERQAAMNKLLSEARRLRSPIAQVIEMKLNGQSYDVPLVGGNDPGAYSSPTANNPDRQPVSRYQPTPTSQQTPPPFSSGYVVPANTNSGYRPADYSYLEPAAEVQAAPASGQRSPSPAQYPSFDTPSAVSDANDMGFVSETGRITIISDQPRQPNIFYAYHRELAPGSVLYVDIPGNPGFVELRVVGRLPAGSPYLIGLPAACYEALLGSSAARDLTVTYQR